MFVMNVSYVKENLCLIWIVYSSFRKTSKVVSLFLEPISKSDIWYCINKLKRELEIQG